MPVKLTIERGPFAGVQRTDVARRARAILAAATDAPRVELSLVLTDDERIQELNRVYRKKNKPTDVLAFAQAEGELGKADDPLLGDVVVSVPTARRQAEHEGRPLIAELTMLIAHGVLHLLGWDHDTSAKDRAMRAETDRLCAAARAASGRRRADIAKKPPRSNNGRGTGGRS